MNRNPSLCVETFVAKPSFSGGSGEIVESVLTDQRGLLISLISRGVGSP